MSATEGYTTVAPWIVTDDTPVLLEFIVTAFDGAEPAQVPLEDGSLGHGEIRIGDTVLLAFDHREGWPPTPASPRVFVPDADAATTAAVAAGARIVTPLLTQAFGQRGSRVREPFGHIWWIDHRHHRGRLAREGFSDASPSPHMQTPRTAAPLETGIRMDRAGRSGHVATARDPSPL